MIQKRMTTVGSDQPRCSKWWWIGAIRKTRLPVRLNTATWMTTLSASSTNRPPMIARTNSCLVATAIVPSAPPSARLPVSPMKTVAGALDVGNAEIFGEPGVAGEVSDQQEGNRGDDHRHGRQPIEPIGQVHRIAEGDDDEGAEQDVEPAKVEHRLLHEGDVKLGAA